MQGIAISVGMWLVKLVVRALLKRISATFQDKLKPVAIELKEAAAKTENKWDDKAAGVFADAVEVEQPPCW